MMIYYLLNRPYKTKKTQVLVSLFFVCSLFSFSQVTTKIDTTTIRLGEQINYKINVVADTMAYVVFPKGQTFTPMENVEDLPVDTIRKQAKFLLSKLYKLTQFDSGQYTIPRQKISIDSKPFFTDSLQIKVNTVQVDTLKQNLFDIKPIILVEKPINKTLKYSLIILLCVGLVAFLIYWFIWRKKPLTEEEEIALLAPYDRAKMGIKKLEAQNYLQTLNLKAYYSDLTLVIRKYLDEKVYDRALESTTDELIARLQILKEGNQIPLKNTTIQYLESILKRADLVKFAKSKPNLELAELDKQTIDKEIDAVKNSLPEPSEEEKLLNQQYKEAQQRKKKRKKIIITTVIAVSTLIATFVGFGIKYGFTYVTDTIIGNESKTLLEGTWVKSAYGFPPIYIETPKVLKRQRKDENKLIADSTKVASFKYRSDNNTLDIHLSTTTFTALDEEGKPKALTEEEKAQDLFIASEAYIKVLEEEGATDISVKRKQFSTPNKAQGIKTFGSMNYKFNNENIRLKYCIFLFRAENVRQQIAIQWPDNSYANSMVQRIENSIELSPNQQKDAKQNAK